MPSARAKSAGLLAWRRADDGRLEVFLVHPGGPFWAKKDEGAWTIPKGVVDPGEDPADAARREFAEETGCRAGDATLVPLGEARQKSGKVIVAWAFEGDCDAGAIVSNLFELEWPPRTGRMQSFPEVDRAAWFAPAEALRRILPGQRVFVERLEAWWAGSRTD